MRSHDRHLLRTLGGLLMAVSFVSCVSGPVSPGAGTSPRGPLFTFVFDDGDDTDFLAAWPIFQAWDVPACSAVITDKIGTRGFLSIDQLKTLRDHGWEIMSHTVTHPHLPSLDASELENEFSVSKAALERSGFPVHNVVYPFNQSNRLVQSIARKYFRSGRGGGYAFDTTATDPFALKSYPRLHDLERMKRIVDEGCLARAWVIVYQHKVDLCAALREQSGFFKPDERLVFTPSGAVARCEHPTWLQCVRRLYCAPLSGTPRPGDAVTGVESGVTARLDRIVYDDQATLRDFLAYIRLQHPDMLVVTVDQGLDILGLARPAVAPDGKSGTETVARTGGAPAKSLSGPVVRTAAGQANDGLSPPVR